MGYSLQDWRARLAARADLTQRLVHLTRGTDSKTPVQILVEILTRGKIRGSTTESGFIVGTRPATCLQDAPLYAVTQNLHFEQNLRAGDPTATLRYSAIGLSLPKEVVFRAGGRPVFYGKTDELKSILSANEWWRIVNMDLSVNDRIIDWTHEREWRVPDELQFDVSDAVVLVNRKEGYAAFVEEARKVLNRDLIGELSGIVVLQSVWA